MNQTLIVRIIGAGFSGLSTAYFLNAQGIAVEILEASDRVGGLMRTDNDALLRTEYAANGFIATALLEQIADDIGVTLQAASKPSRKRFIYWHRPRRWPLSLAQTLSCIPVMLRTLFVRHSLTPRNNESVAQWARRIAGPFLNERLLQPMLQGIYAGDTEKLSAELILGPLFLPKHRHALQRGRFRGTVAPVGGMQTLTDRLAEVLVQRGVKIHLNDKAQVHHLERRPVVVATNALVAAEFIRGLEAPSMPTLLPPEMLPIIRASFSWQKPQKTLRGFGVLFTEGQDFRALGVLSDTDIFPGSHTAHQESWLFGGAKDRQVLHLSDAEIHALVQKERAQLLGDTRPADAMKIIRWTHALPHYTVAWKCQLEAWQAQREKYASQGLYFVGNYLGSLGLSRILQQNQMIAQRIADNVSQHP